MPAQVWTSWPGGIGWPTPIPVGGKRNTRKSRKNRKSKSRKNRKTRNNRK